MTTESVVYVVPDKMGGMMNIIANLLEHRRPDGFGHHAILTHNHRSTDTRFARPLAADTQATVEYTLPEENLHAVMRRLAHAVPPGPGVYIAGDLLDLATASVHDFGRAVIYMLHGDSDYYYDLAVKHDAVVHAFIAYSRRMYDRLMERLPHRADTIFHLPYGIPLPADARLPASPGSWGMKGSRSEGDADARLKGSRLRSLTVPPSFGEARRSAFGAKAARSGNGRLRLAFAGRLEQGQKGVFDLPEIDRALAAQGVAVEWTIAGAGPDEIELKRRWAFNPEVRWLGALSNADVLALYATQDVFVLPTRVEGFPVALVEAMGAGVVPVVSDIESGVPEVVASALTGERPPVGDVRAFAQAIAGLDGDRPRLAAMSAAARRSIAERFDIRDRIAEYQALYARWRELYRPLAAGRHLQYGSRLDQPWIPNAVVRLVRSAARHL